MNVAWQTEGVPNTGIHHLKTSGGLAWWRRSPWGQGNSGRGIVAPGKQDRLPDGHFPALLPGRGEIVGVQCRAGGGQVAIVLFPPRWMDQIAQIISQRGR